MYIKKIVVVGLLLATVNASQAAAHGRSSEDEPVVYRDAALSVYARLADGDKNAAAVAEVKRVGSYLGSFDDSNADQVGTLALALGGKSHGLSGLEAFYGTATPDAVVTGWRSRVPSSASVSEWASDHRRGLTVGGIALAAAGLGGVGYKQGWADKVKGLLPSRLSDAKK